MASASLYVGPAARRYARALFAAAIDADALDAVGSDLEVVAVAVGDAEIAAWLEDPRVDDRQRESFLEKKMGDGFHRLTLNLFQVLARRRRHSALLGIPQAFSVLVNVHEGRILGVVETALPLTDSDREELEHAFSLGTGKQVLLEPRIEKKLLGGARVTLGGFRYDGSARGRLDSIRGRLAQATTGQS